MARQQQESLARALQRARQNGLVVVGRGVWDRNGARFMVMGSASEPGRFHLVTIYPGRLVCDCPSRTLCQHRALVHEELAAQAQRSAVVAATNELLAGVVASTCEQWQRGRWRREHERDRDRRRRERERVMALPASRCDNRPVSIWTS